MTQMRQGKSKKQLPHFATFNAAYCSGFFVDNDALVTTMCLLFDRIWLLNHFEIVVEFSKKFLISDYSDHFEDNRSKQGQFQGLMPKMQVQMGIEIKPSGKVHPFATLTPTQRKTAWNYIYHTSSFCLRYNDLFQEHVLCTDLYPDGEIISNVEFDEDTRTITMKSNKYLNMVMGKDTVKELDALVSRGAVPILSDTIGILGSNAPRLSPKYLSSLLAMKAVELTLPQTKPAPAETILEARERLRDLLAPFWGAMFKLSTDFNERIKQGQPLRDIERECEDFIDTTVRPALIELNSKLEMDRKSWFHKILSAVAKEMKLMIGKPPLTTAGLVSSGLQLGANVALDVVQDETSSHDAGLIYLIELDKLMRKT